MKFYDFLVDTNGFLNNVSTDSTDSSDYTESGESSESGESGESIFLSFLLKRVYNSLYNY